MTTAQARSVERLIHADAQAIFDVLAVLGFGSSAPASDDPRWLRVPLPR